MSLSAPTYGPVLADALVRSRSVLSNVALVATGAAVVTAAAQISVPLWPVPVTGQTLAVLIVGVALGPWRGAASLLLYAVIGIAGLPVFANFTGGPLSVLKPSFGFVIGFIPAAFLAGWMARRAWDRRFLQAFGGFALASTVPFAVGLPYLALMLGALGLDNSVSTVVASGLVPFIPGGIVKALLAAAIIPLAWRGVRAVDRHREQHGDS